MKKLKFGCHSFLNARPLIQHLLNIKPENLPFEIVLGTPAEIAEKLSKGKIDIGFIPSIEFLRNKNLFLFPGFSISSYKEVMSVLLLTDKKIEKIKTVQVDERSRTSVVLLRIILEKQYGIKPKLVDAVKKNSIADAQLLIGDEALHISYGKREEDKQYYLDLSYEWYRLTKLPFVFAVIASREKTVPKEVLDFLDESKKKGMKLIGEIATKEHKACSIRESEAYDYLSKKIHYTLRKKELQGFQKFQEVAFEIGELKEKRELIYIKPQDAKG